MKKLNINKIRLYCILNYSADDDNFRKYPSHPDCENCRFKGIKPKSIKDYESHKDETCPDWYASRYWRYQPRSAPTTTRNYYYKGVVEEWHITPKKRQFRPGKGIYLWSWECCHRWQPIDGWQPSKKRLDDIANIGNDIINDLIIL